MLTFLIFRKSSFAATLTVLTATRRPMYIPDLMSANPLEANSMSETSTSPDITMRSGSIPWRSTSLLKAMKKACFWADSRM